MAPVMLAEQWQSGDYVYGAVNTHSYPGGLAHRLVNGREYPVARLAILGVSADGALSFGVDRWIKRDERFPEPIKGFNY